MKNLEMLLKWEMHPSRRLLAFRDPDATELRNPWLADPAQDPGRTWFIEHNMNGMPMYAAGVALGDEGIKAMGVRVLDHGRSKQLEDGSFPGEDVHHSAAFFFESQARYVALAPLTGAGDAEAHRQSLDRGICWFHRRSTWLLDDWWCDSLHHRFFLNASCLFLGHGLIYTDEPAYLLRAQAYSWMAEGIRRQRADGAHTELGGADTSYHSLSLLYGTVVLMVCDQLSPDFAGELEQSLHCAADWLLQRVDGDGNIDAGGNTRTGPNSTERNRATGKPKSHSPHVSAFALEGAGLVLERDDCRQAADQILQQCVSGSLDLD